ncbi:MFS general substrate transporter, partial [Aureobasidium melanogenum]
MSKFAEMSRYGSPVCVQFRSSLTFITLTASFAVFTDIFLYGIIIPVLPFALTSRVGLEAKEVQTWLSVMLAIYGGAMFCASPVCGWASDRIGSCRRFLLVGLVALGMATSLLLLARDLPLLIVARALLGISAAVVWVAGPALLADSVDPGQIGLSMGIMGDAMGLAIIAAPAIGGVVFERVVYDAIFFICFGLIGLDMAFRLLVIENGRITKLDSRHNKQELETSPANSTIATKSGMSALPPAPVMVSEDGASIESHLPENDDQRTVTNVKKWKDHLWPILALLLSPRLAADLLGCLIQAILFTSLEAVLPLQLQESFHWDSLEAGLAYLPLTLPALISPLVGWLTDRYQARLPCVVGFGLAALSFASLRFVTDDTLDNKIVFCCLVTVIGSALTLVLIPLMADITRTVEQMESSYQLGSCSGGAYGQAYALFNMAYAAGSAIGPLLAGFLRVRTDWAATTLTLACLSGASVVPIALWAGAWGQTMRDDPKTAA